MSNKPSKDNPAGQALILGLGNGGCKALAAMAQSWPDGPARLGLNTAAAAADLAGLRCVQFGAQVIKGLGSGGDPRLGRRAAAEDLETIRPLLRDVDLLFLVVGLGGGTGTGAAPLLVEEARKAGALTLCFAMLPFEFEGRRRMEQAQRGLQALENVADGVICLPNQRLLATLENRTNLATAFRQADISLGRCLQAIWRIIYRKGVINLDLADIRALLHSGANPCVLGCAEAAGPTKIDLALKAIGEDPLLENGQALAKAHSYLVSIIGGADLTLQEVDRLIQGIAARGRPEALAMTGVSCDPDWRDKVFIAILAATGSPSGPALAAAKSAEHVAAVAATPLRDKQLIQGNLFDLAGHSIFKDIEPTIIAGNNLDLPTFTRRGIMIRKAQNANA